MGVEAYRGLRFYSDVTASRTALLALKADLDLDKLTDTPEAVAAKQESLRTAARRLDSAASFVRNDPLLAAASRLPVAGKQVRGMREFVLAAHEAAHTGIAASDVALAFAAYERNPNRTSIEDAVDFLQRQEQSMAVVAAGLERLKTRRDAVPGGLYGPLAAGRDDLDAALSKLDGLVSGYQRAENLLPGLLGYDGSRRYLVLPQNDTELFPSGGLISSYGIATFDKGRLVSMDLEYYGSLFDRWQRQSGGEYVEPPGPLKDYLKRDYSWGLGEAGWYPDFSTTAELARSFVAKGGAPPTDGTIAIDLKFIAGLLELLGNVYVSEYNVNVTAANLNELTLELTREEDYVPYASKKAFLSYLAGAVLNRVYAVPKERWIDLLSFLDRMGRERHLQINFRDPDMQALSSAYGLDGDLIEPEGDFLMLADTSVNSTKLNLILDTKASLDLRLESNGTSRALVTYTVSNPFNRWQAGRDPKLVSALMLDGVYGCYLRVYASPESRLIQTRLDGAPAGAEQDAKELGKSVFGRFMPVGPGATRSLQYLYSTPDSVERGADGLYRYSLYVQKQAGTGALPLALRIELPTGADRITTTLDGRSVAGTTIETDLRTDRRVEVVYRLP